MFVLLEHRVSSSPGAEPHWDLLVEVPAREGLPTWRLARNPVEVGGQIPAQRLPDHRRLYLDYEGEIAGGRGSVRRVDRGPASVLCFEGDRLLVALDGRHLHGRFEIAAEPAGQMVFRPATESE